MKIRLILNNNPIDPLGVMSLISNTDAEFDVKFVPGEAYDENIKSYDIAAFSTITGSHLYHNEIAKQLKILNNNLITFMGGPHPTFFPQEAINLSHIDYICVGEGVSAFNNWIHGKPTNNIYHKYRVIDLTKIDPLVNLNTLKPPDRSLIYRNKSRANNPIKDFIGNLGCPHNCSYCFNHSWSELYKGQPRLRYLDPIKYVDEIKECRDQYGMRLISLQEDNPIVNKEWFHEVTERIIYKVNVPYHCNVRCDMVDEHLIKHMKKTGCTCVTFAIENGDDAYRREYLNRRMSNEMIIEAARLFRKHGIRLRTQNILCLPNQDLNGDIKTLDLNIKCRPAMAWASIFQPFTNTSLGKRAIDIGEWSGSVDTISRGYFEESPLKIKDKKKRERLQKVFMMICSRPRLRKLLKIILSLPLDSIYKWFYSKHKKKEYVKFYGI